jgi:hypothetical protein
LTRLLGWLALRSILHVLNFYHLRRTCRVERCCLSEWRRHVSELRDGSLRRLLGSADIVSESYKLIEQVMSSSPCSFLNWLLLSEGLRWLQSSRCCGYLSSLSPRWSHQPLENLLAALVRIASVRV